MENSNSPVAIVTGGAVRVGRAISLGLARNGFDVVAHFNSSSADAASLAEEVEALGRTCVTVQADLSQTTAPAQLAAAVAEHFDRVDLLVNNAASFHEQPLFDASAEEWDQVMAVNLRAPFLVTQAMLPLLRRAQGSVVNIVDVSAFEPWVRYPHHAVSKAGLLHLTRIMARELGPDIRANAIAPGTVLPPEGLSDPELDRERQKILVQELGSPEDVVRTVLYLAESPFVTGEVIVVDGGLRWGR